MKRPFVVFGLLIVVAVAIVAITQLQPERLTAVTLEKAQAVQKKLDQNSATSKEEAQQLAQAAPAAPAKPQEPAKSEGNNVFKVKFECSNGDFVVECHRDWAPLGVARFEELVKSGFYNEDRFFRVVPGFVVQFGLSGDPAVNKQWFNQRIQDDPVKQTNAKGTLTFATSGKNTRTTQLFINLVDNARLDSMGFSPFGKIVEGMDVVQKITAQYGEMPDQQMIQFKGNEYLKAAFPKMDYIKTATIVP
jgi:cyclophilin family peptidyl-prolyl cis-trans isomerase